jgi:glycosyltransferase involved in cell wall biosynthesis
LRVAFLTWKDVAHPMAGGSEVLVDRLATGLHERGHDVTVISGAPVGEHPYRIVDAGGPHVQYLKDPVLLRRHVGSVDVVVDICNGVPFFSPLWSRAPVLALVNHVHVGMWSEWFSPVPAAIGRAIEMRLMPAVYRSRPFVAVSDSTRDVLVSLGIPAANISVVHNGVEVPDAAPQDPSWPPTFAAVGRLVPHKRFDLLLRAWRRVREELGTGVLEVAGTGPLAEALAQEAPPHTRFLGRVSDAERDDLLARAWCVIQPSRLEGWGLVVMEAAARGTPTIGFRVAGTKDAIADDESGVLVDSEDELVAAWVRLAREPETRARLSKGAAERAQQFSWERTVDSFEAVLRRTGRARPPRP